MKLLFYVACALVLGYHICMRDERATKPAGRGGKREGNGVHHGRAHAPVVVPRLRTPNLGVELEILRKEGWV